MGRLTFNYVFYVQKLRIFASVLLLSTADISENQILKCTRKSSRFRNVRL